MDRYKFEVYSWVKIKEGDDDVGPDYEYQLAYAGDKFEDAVRVMCNEKANGIGCVRLEWRR